MKKSEKIYIFEKGESKRFKNVDIRKFEKLIKKDEHSLMFNTNHYHNIKFHLSVGNCCVNYPINFFTLWTANGLLRVSTLVKEIEIVPISKKEYETILKYM